MTLPESLNDRLERWAQTHPTTLSNEDRQTRDSFVEKFPLEHLRELTLEQYAIGRGDTENFCYWLEWGTGTLGSIRGGASKKFGVYWSQSKKEYMVNAMFSSPEDAKDRILDAICEAAKCLTTGDIAGADEASARMGDNRYTVRLKPLSLYFPDKLLPISKPDDLKELLHGFGQDTSGDQLALNTRLLRYLREQPAASTFDTVGLMRFLYAEYVYAEYVRPPAVERQIWKVAPGPNAVYLDTALKQGAIFIGSRAEDLSVIPTSDMAARLAELGDPQSAYVASAFAHTMQEGDVVIANQGKTRVVAVGLIEGPYQAPDAEFNPLGDEFSGEDLGWRHARRVRWLLTGAIDLPAGVPTLAIKSVSLVAEQTLQKILDAYHAGDASPEMEVRLTELGWMGLKLGAELPDDVRYLVDLAGHTRNIVLYGPPGTGKTRLAREFARAWVGESSLPRPVPQSSSTLTWWQAVMLALADLGEAKVQQIVDHSTVQSLAEQRPDNKHVDATVSHQLVKYMHPEDKTSTSVDRREPYVFTRNEDKSLWTLTETGQAEVQKLKLAGQPALQQPVAAPALQAVHHVTFHPAFTYEEFIEGLRPDGQGNFKVRDGVFKRLCRQAHQNPDQDFVLIIDEINRADTAKTFGELITLIEDDKRTRPGSHGEFPVTLPYSDAPDNLFSVPDNVYIVGTMNTADRSITLMDVALRRRFTFVEVAPQPSLITGVEDGLSLNALLTLLNERLTADLDADHRIGHAYLMGETLGARGVVFRWRHKVVPLLQEYYYARDAALRSLLGETLYLDATRTQVMSDEGLMDALRQWTSAASPGGVQ